MKIVGGKGYEPYDYATQQKEIRAALEEGKNVKMVVKIETGPSDDRREFLAHKRQREMENKNKL